MPLFFFKEDAHWVDEIKATLQYSALLCNNQVVVSDVESEPDMFYIQSLIITSIHV